MKRLLFVALLSLLILTSCQQDDTFKPAAELPFATHPSVLRGDWSGTIFNIPESKDSTLELTDLTATCSDNPEEGVPEGQCYRYTLSGSISVDGSSAVPITGDGYAGAYIYTLTSPPVAAPPGVDGTFELDGERWGFYADYRPDNFPNIDGEPAFEGYISLIGVDGRGSSFRLEPTP